MPQPAPIGKISSSLIAVWIIMGASVVRATGLNQPEMRIPMTPPNITVAPGLKLCGKGIHEYLEGLKACPQCTREYKKKHHLANQEKYNAAFAKRYERVKNDPVEKEKNRKAKLRLYNHGYHKAVYYADIEASRQKAREYREKNKDRAVWEGMLKRCYDPKNNMYEYYGARGITVCPQWLGKTGYKQFISDMGPRPTPQHSLDRKKNDEGYYPDNCKWATDVEQGRNKRNNINVTFIGKTQPVSAWAEEMNIPYHALYQRIVTRKWTIERAMNEPFRQTSHSTHGSLCKRGMQWLYKEVGCQVACVGLGSTTGERPDVIGWKLGESWLIECKARREDFFREKEKSFRSDPILGMGKFRYYLIPDDIICTDEIPPKWGMLIAHGKSIIIAKEAEAFSERNKDAEIVILTCALRRTFEGGES